ncbi:DegT/DnrJ/EryC1/StrS family aminotransferase [Streptomyces fuscigenes]|uniref:DegT/DnrJ/EryC1/StrS family aminotransferase n=1 Tax=Streptomyces fuscigenes TaxID=1528880 RepID=UPI001F2A31D0|nr:DegT/DnrJ/EryC1/StrS family aminotransferase [Streptomyces fuscigenes]MCF3960629.1 DegT/DnrJ/EryC1/StrS family aminotransferase [Streptomyces fuscigenes]
MGRRLGRECLYMPSCRLGLYVALRHWCPPGGRVLMSPVNDDVIFFVVLAAGLRPVQAPLNARDGSIDMSAVPEDTWRGLSAVLTTNLYGNPDPGPELRLRCDALGIPLIEDAAHAIGSTHADGSPVGAVGDASVFSLSKHVGAKTGGFLAFADPGLREELAALRDTLLKPARFSSEALYAIRPYAEAGVRGMRLVGAARAALRVLGAQEREEIRMPLRVAELERAVRADGHPARARAAARAGRGNGTGPVAAPREAGPAAMPQEAGAPGPPGAPGLDPLESWVRVDMHPYRISPGRVRLRRTTGLLAGLDGKLARHAAGTARLQGAAPDAVQPLFRVPLLVRDRDAAIAALARHRITVGYLYDPPLDAYAGEAFTDPSPSPAGAAWFARHALPVDPCRADEVLGVLTALRMEPVGPPPGEDGAGG